MRQRNNIHDHYSYQTQNGRRWNCLGERARILIVDDDESIRKVVATILHEKGYAVDTAETGKEAISKSNKKFYNLALIDMRPPDMEGTQLLMSMRETTPRMVKIIMTGYPSLQNAMEAVNKNADAYLLKPVNMDKVLSMIDAHLKRQSRRICLLVFLSTIRYIGVRWLFHHECCACSVFSSGQTFSDYAAASRRITSIT